MCASASAGAWRRCRSALIGEPADLTYDYEYLGAGPETLAEVLAGRHGFADKLQGARSGRSSSSARARSRAPTARPCSSLAAQARRRAVGAVTAELERLLASCTPPPRASGRSISASCRGRAGSTPPRWPRRRARRAVQSRRRRDRHRAGRLRDLPGHPWRPRRAPRRRDPAGRRLHREVGHLRQHRRPRADGQPRRLPAGRRPRGLGDPAGAVGRARAPAAVRFPARSCAQKLYAEYPHFAAIDAIAPSDVAAAVQALAAIGGTPRASRSVSPVHDFYLTNPIARASRVMAECSALARERRLEAAE